MEDLRNHLFATIEALLDSENPMDTDRAKAINHTAQTVINSAKVEVAFIEATGVEPAGRFFATFTDNRNPVQPVIALPASGRKSLRTDSDPRSERR
jgi:hypothetical protein